MHRPAPPRSRRARRGALVVAATTTLLLGSAVPASAQAAPVEVAGATAATALALTLNLPGGDATRLILVIDPVTGTVSRISATTAARGAAEVITGSFGGQALGSGPSVAMLPAPLTDTDNPGAAFADALAGTPLENLLSVELLPSSAAVTPAPNSTSQASVANLGAGLPDAISDALDPVTQPLIDAVAGALTALIPVGTTIEAACGTISVIPGVTELCALLGSIEELRNAVSAALSDLTGATGVLGTGLITGRQTITSDAAGITAQATASVADLTLLGQQALVGAEVLRTTSTAVAKGTPGSADATLESTVAGARLGTIDPFVDVRATIDGIEGTIGDTPISAMFADLFTQVFDTLNAALAPVGVTLVKNDASPNAQPLAACPTELNGLQTGTFEAADGTCAAAATRGVGIQVLLPEALASALMITGPLVELQIVPSAAVARAQVAPIVTPPPPPVEPQLPRTGVDSTMLSGIGALLLLGAVALRRRRTLGSAA